MHFLCLNIKVSRYNVLYNNFFSLRAICFTLKFILKHIPLLIIVAATPTEEE